MTEMNSNIILLSSRSMPVGQTQARNSVSSRANENLPFRLPIHPIRLFALTFALRTSVRNAHSFGYECLS